MRLWVLSWAARGWQPRILLSGEKFSGILVSPSAINFSQKPPKTKHKRISVMTFGDDDWEESPVVVFPDAQTDDGILACGRPLDL